MTGISTFASHRILDWLLGRSNLTVPSTFFLALSTTPLDNDGIGATEPTDPAYSRMALPNDKATFSTASSRSVRIIREFLWKASTVNWPRCTHYLLYDSNVGGNIWFYGELQGSIDVEIETSPLLEADVNELAMDICGGSTADMSITTWATNRILDHLFGRTPILTPPANWFVGVSTTPISAEGIGYTEPTTAGYQRVQIPNNKNSFTMAADKAVTLAQEFRFPKSGAPWGIQTHFFVTDALTGDNIWWSGRLVHSRNVEVSTTLALLPDGFNWILDSCVDQIGASGSIAPLAAGLQPLSGANWNSRYWG